MTNLDQFESVFKSAAKPTFELKPIRFNKCLGVIDDVAEQGPFQEQATQFVRGLPASDAAEIEFVSTEKYDSVQKLLEYIEQYQPDLVCCYRNLHLHAPDYPHSVGIYVEVLTQATDLPILLLPHPSAHPTFALPQTVMAITDHLENDPSLVSCAVNVTPKGGKLLLTHLEDEVILRRYLDAIGKIPEIDTETAEATITEKLLEEPHEFVKSCSAVIAEHDLGITLDESVSLGHRLKECQDLVREHRVGLLVMNTKDKDQLAMHGLAYPVSVELRDIPLLLL